MKAIRTIMVFLSMIVLGWAGWLYTGPSAGIRSASASHVLHVPGDFDTIQDAVDDAGAGDVIKVAAGFYQENVSIAKSDLRLLGKGVILDGTDLGGIGIHVVGASEVEIKGFTVQNFEAGIVLEGTEDSRVSRNELRNNDSDTATLRDGLQLVNSHNIRVTGNFAHDNGHNGITLKGASTGNTLLGNVSQDNGNNPAVAAAIGGCGIQLIAGGNNDNNISGNETLRNGWGIQIGGGSDNNSVTKNSSHGNDRAGVAALDPGSGNFIAFNDATGNGLADVSPSFEFDLFDQGPLDNTWVGNLGSANF